PAKGELCNASTVGLRSTSALLCARFATSVRSHTASGLTMAVPIPDRTRRLSLRTPLMPPCCLECLGQPLSSCFHLWASACLAWLAWRCSRVCSARNDGACHRIGVQTMFLWRFVKKLLSRRAERDRDFILKHLTVAEMEEIMGPELVNEARREMGLPPLP